MENERAQIVMKVQPLASSDRSYIIESLLRLESVASATVDVKNGIVRVDGAASDVELLQAMEGLGKHAVVITHTRGVAASAAYRDGTAAPPRALKAQLFMRLMKKNVGCCAD